MSFVADVIPPACYIFYGMINKGGTWIAMHNKNKKNESSNIQTVNKNDDNERLFVEYYADCLFYDEIMLQW